MTEQNGQVPAIEQNNITWSPASFRALRDALKRPGLVTLKLWPENPECEVTLDMSGMASLMLAGKLANKMLTEKEQAIKETAAKLVSDDSVMNYREVTVKTIEQHDYILGAVVVSPKYYMLDQLPAGGQPDDGLCVWDFTAEMRWSIIDVLNSGGEAFAKFRDDPIGYAAALSESIAARAAERFDSTTGDAVVDQSAIQSGDLVSREGTSDENGGGSDAPDQIKKTRREKVG